MCSRYRNWFNFLNVKSKLIGKLKRDQYRGKIDEENLKEKVEYLSKFAKWVEQWQLSGRPGLSQNTFSALLHTAKGIIDMVKHVAHFNDMEYILTGLFQSDALEGRFCSYRQLCGANYHNSVLQFSQAEK